MKIRYNAPVTLTFALVSLIILLSDAITGSQITLTFFSVPPDFHSGSVLSYFRLISHAMGHVGWSHYVGNFTFILLIGPVLEEKYGSALLLEMIFVTALVTGILNTLFFTHSLLGASGIVFMMILLASFTNFRAGEVPLTFILITGLFLVKEVMGALGTDQISQFAHILGGAFGGLFGFVFAVRKRSN